MLRRWLARIEFKTGGYFSPVVTVCFAINLVVFLVCFFSADPHGGGATAWLSANRPDVLDGEVWRLLSAGFTHEDPWHLVFNMLMLGFFGHVVEQRLGHRGMTALVLAAVVLGNALFVALFANPHGVIGFSGAGYAIIVAFATIAPHARVIFIIFPMPAWLLVSILVGIGVLSSLSGRSGGVAHEVHLVGAALGFVSIYWQARLARIRRRMFGWLATRRQAVREYREQADQGELDRLLEKVSSEGLHSLTPAERRFLDRYSKNQR